MYAASSDARNATALLISSTLPILERGIISSTDFFCSSDKTFVISVSIYPGATALTVIPRDASSFAADLVIPITPALEAL